MNARCQATLNTHTTTTTANFTHSQNLTDPVAMTHSIFCRIILDDLCLYR